MQSVNQPRKHHYIPVSYLANFTNDGTERSKLFVFDQNSGNQWQSRPRKIAFENNFHTVETEDGLNYHTFEEAFSQVEGNAKRVIVDIMSSMKVPMYGTEDYNWLINFIALLSERTPARRKHFNDSIEEVYKMAAKVGVHHKEYFERIKSEIEARNGKDSNLSHEQMMDYLNKDEYSVKFNNNFHMDNFMTRLDAIIEPLAERKWSVVYCPSTIGDFICSDNPVCLRNLTKKVGIFSSPGHGVLDTEVSVPLSPRIALIGRFEEYMTPVVHIPDRKSLASYNSYTGMYADKYIFSKKSDFLWLNTELKVCDIEDFKRELVGKVGH